MKIISVIEIKIVFPVLFTELVAQIFDSRNLPTAYVGFVMYKTLGDILPASFDTGVRYNCFHHRHESINSVPMYKKDEQKLIPVYFVIFISFDKLFV